MKKMVVTSFQELDFLIQEYVLNYTKTEKTNGTFTFHGINEWGRNEFLEANKVPPYTKYPLNCRTIYKKFIKDKVGCTFIKEGDVWEVVIGRRSKGNISEDKSIHIAFIKAALLYANVNVDVEIPKGELNKCSIWFSELCEEYQIHVVTNNLANDIRNAFREDKLEKVK